MTPVWGQFGKNGKCYIPTFLFAGDSPVVPKGFTGTWQMLGNYRELVAIEREAYEPAYSAP